ALFQPEEAVEHLEGDQVPGHTRRRQLLVAQEGQVVAQVEDAGAQVVLEAAAGDPGGKAVQVAAVGQHGVFGLAAFRLYVVTEGLDVVGQGAELLRGVGRHGASFPGKARTRLLYTRQVRRSTCGTNLFWMTFRIRELGAERKPGQLVPG